MSEGVDALTTRLLAAVDAAADVAALDAVRVEALGKKGALPAQMKTLGALDPDARKAAGAALNAAKTEISDAIDARKAALSAAALDAQLAAETLDLSLDPAPRPAGKIHPITRVIDEAVAIFADMGFTVAEGPQIEDDFHNFDALNIPPEHPARQEHDTFYLPPLDEDGAPLVLRTHTSPVQIRSMTGSTPPIRIVAPGRTYRADMSTPVKGETACSRLSPHLAWGTLSGREAFQAPAARQREDVGERKLNISRFAPPEVFEEYCAERRFDNGWQKRPGVQRNEALDLSVYSLALVVVLEAEAINRDHPPNWATPGIRNLMAVPYTDADGNEKMGTLAPPVTAPTAKRDTSKWRVKRAKKKHW